MKLLKVNDRIRSIQEYIKEIYGAAGSKDTEGSNIVRNASVHNFGPSSFTNTHRTHTTNLSCQVYLGPSPANCTWNVSLCRLKIGLPWFSPAPQKTRIRPNNGTTVLETPRPPFGPCPLGSTDFSIALVHTIHTAGLVVDSEWSGLAQLATRSQGHGIAALCEAMGACYSAVVQPGWNGKTRETQID